MKKAKLLSIKFEPLSEESESLLGGFSASLSATSFDNGSGANNCTSTCIPTNPQATCGTPNSVSGCTSNDVAGCGG